MPEMHDPLGNKPQGAQPGGSIPAQDLRSISALVRSLLDVLDGTEGVAKLEQLSHKLREVLDGPDEPPQAEVELFLRSFGEAHTKSAPDTRAKPDLERLQVALLYSGVDSAQREISHRGAGDSDAEWREILREALTDFLDEYPVR